MDRGQLILDAATEAFHDKGFHGVGMDELGRRSGLSGPALYRHFAGKDQILAGVLDRALDELSAAAAPSAPLDPAADLVRVLRHHVEFAAGHRSLLGVYQREADALVDPYRRAFDRRRREYIGRWELLVSRRFPQLPTSDVAAVTQALLGTVFSMTSWTDRAARRADAGDMLLRLITDGLGAFDPSHA